MSRLVDRIVPDPGPKSRPATVSAPTSTPPSDHSGDNGNTGYSQRLEALEASLGQPQPALTPESSPAHPSATPSTYDPLDATRRTLNTLFPSQSDIGAITGASVAAFFVGTVFHTFRDLIEGRCESADAVSIIPPPDSHPVVLARRLLQICICMQQIPPGFDLQKLDMKTSVVEVMTNIVATVSRLVTSDDDLITNSEGLQCLVLQGFWHSNIGNLRKSWLAYRKAVGLAQLMGLDRGSSRALKSVNQYGDPKQLPTPFGLWYRINCFDRFSSLLLGLPAGSADYTYASEDGMKRDTDMEKLEKMQTVIAGRIIERNTAKSLDAYAKPADAYIRSADAYTMTQAIDIQLQSAASTMDDEWWTEPVLDPFEGKEHNLGLMFRLFRQTQHYDLLIHLHLPYMLQSPPENQLNYSKETCVRASREVLKRFVSFRTLYNSAWSCRHIDYSALVAAMTLLLSYLRQGDALLVPTATSEERSADRKLIEKVRERMHHLAVVNRDKLSQESAEIVGQMKSILDSVDWPQMARSDPNCHDFGLKCLQLNIPYLGTVNIHPALSAAVDIVCKSKSAKEGCPGTALSPEVSMMGEVAAQQLRQEQPAMANLSTAPVQGFALSSSGLGGISHLDFGDIDLSLLPDDPGSDPIIQGMSMQFDPQPLEGVLEMPLIADADDWTFQGVDTAYWSLLNDSVMNPVS